MRLSLFQKHTCPLRISNLSQEKNVFVKDDKENNKTPITYLRPDNLIGSSVGKQ